MSLDDGTLNNGTDTGHAFMMMGPDTITGVYNGFLNITPDLGSVATRFAGAFKGDAAGSTADDLVMISNATGSYSLDGVTINGAAPTTGMDTAVNNFNGMFAGSTGNLGGTSAQADGMNKFTVAGFKQITMGQMSHMLNNGDGSAPDATLAHIPAGFKKAILDTWQGLIAPISQGGYGSANAAKTALGLTTATADSLKGSHMLALGFQPLYDSNLSNLTSADDSAFDYMSNTTFKTFDAFANAGSTYVYNMPENEDLDVAFRFKDSTVSGVNYSLNASYNYDKNPIIDLSWRGSDNATLATRQTYHQMSNGAGITKAAYDALGTTARSTTLQLYDPAVSGSATAITNAGVNTVNATATNGFYGGQAAAAVYTAAFAAATGTDQQKMGAAYTAAQSHRAKLQFSQEVKRVKQIGGSFDTAIETAALGPVVIRGEALYTKDGYSPVMNKDKLAYGDLVGALEMVKGDRAKIVLGADITAMTNMMISAQFIQDSNLDFVDNGNHYTADYATMHLSNGFNKAVKDKNFYSLFFSKPFGASGEHRWNNITMLEEGVGGNGKWNRLDAEFSIDDDTQATVEYNKYWGNVNTQFGQLEKTSNIQVGVKYSF
jgi:hypothetical protein